MDPPPRLWVFSRQTSLVTGKWWSSGLMASQSEKRQEYLWLLWGTEIEIPKGQLQLPLRRNRGGKTIRWSPHPLAGMGLMDSWFAIVPEGTKRDASFPRRWATFSWRAFTVGSSPKTSSPTSCFCHRFSHGRVAGDGITFWDRSSSSSFLQKVLHRSLGADMIWFLRTSLTLKKNTILNTDCQDERENFLHF